MRPLLVLAALTPAPLSACKGAADRKPPPPQAGSDAAAPAPLDGPAPAPDLSFVRGAVYVAAELGGRVRTLALDPATGAWTPLGGDDVNLFPSAYRWQGGLLAIATEGETEEDHVEQLAVVRGAAIERVGPRARAVRNPVVSADGATLVVETSAHGFRDLYRIDAAGRVFRLTENREGNFEPALSPDGQHVAFTSSRDGDAELYRKPLAGGAATRLTAFHRDDWAPQWAADGTRLLFLSDREGPPRAFVAAADGTGQARLTAETDPEVIEDQPRYAPDGVTLAYVRARGPELAIQLLGRDGAAARRLTPEGAADTDFAWSPDGAYLVVNRHALAGGQLGPGQVTFVRVADGKVMAADDSVAPQLVRWVP